MDERFRSGNAGAGDETTNDYIPRLWAARKAGALSREIRLHGQIPELMTALKDLALRYGVLTEYTSYLVQEPNAVALGVDRRDDFARRNAPAAPRDQAGAGAVAQSRGEALQASKSVVAAAAEREELDELLRGRPGLSPTQRIGGRLFILRDSIWTDLRQAGSLPVITVAPFSPAYFALLRAIPELTRPAGLTPAVLVAGGRVSVKIAAGGRETWRAGELEALVRDFRS